MNEKNKKNRRQFLKNTALATLGLASLPNLKTQAKKPLPDCNPTTLDYYGQGPFYTENPPLLENGQLATTYESGQRMIISGRIHNLDCTEFIPNTVVDIWHANDAGQYDNNGYNLRGFTTSNAQGFYMFETIKPGKYLNGSQYRPSHIHFKITPPNFPTLITQIYFEGDTDIANDAAASIQSGTYDARHRIISLQTNAQNVLEGTWDIILNGEGIDVGTSVRDLHLEKGMIYSVSPNPFAHSMNIFYSVFKPAKVSLLIFDMQGKQVATLEERFLTPQKYTAVWQPDAALPKGHYFVVLKLNDLQVHYKKVVKG